MIAWTGSYDVPVAIDGEVDREVPAALARRFGVDRFWERWTRAECVAKLTGRGVVDLLDLMDPAVAGDAGAGVSLSTVCLPGGIVVSVGHLERALSF